MQKIYSHCLRNEKEKRKHIFTHRQTHTRPFECAHIQQEFRILIDRKVQIKIHDATGIFHYLWPFWLRILCHQFPVSNAEKKEDRYFFYVFFVGRSYSSSSFVDKFYFSFFYLVCFYSLDKGHETQLAHAYGIFNIGTQSTASNSNKQTR